MNPELLREHLTSLSDDSYGPNRLTSNPWQYSHGGKKYELATNGHAMLFIEVEESSLEPAPTNKIVNPELLSKWLELPVTHAVSSSRLTAFTGTDDCRNCPYCKGIGKRPVPEPLPVEGEFAFDRFEKSRPVNILGKVIDASLFALIAYPLQFGEAVKVHIPESIDNPLVFHGRKWVIVQMPMKYSAEEAAKFEAYTE